LLNKEPSFIEVFNEIDGDLINFFQCLREDPYRLFSIVYFLPYSRRLYNEIKEVIKNREKWNMLDRFTRAAYYFYLNNASINGQLFSGFKTAKTNKGGIPTKLYVGRISRLFEVAERFRYVIIENLDFERVIKKYDTPDTLFYCDPPYILERKRSDYYRYDFTLEDHIRLANLLNNISGKAAVSYMPHPILEELYPRDKWIWVEKEFITYSTVQTGRRRQRIELLIMNYEPSEKKNGS